MYKPGDEYLRPVIEFCLPKRCSGALAEFQFPIIAPHHDEVRGITNHADLVLGSPKSRFAESILVDFYSPEELALIAKHRGLRLGFVLTDEAVWVGENAAGELRKVNRRSCGMSATCYAAACTANLATFKQVLEASADPSMSTFATWRARRDGGPRLGCDLPGHGS